MPKERCEWSNKIAYSTYSHAANDAKALNRKKRNTGHLSPYRCPHGNHWHVGKASPPEGTPRPRNRKRWRWRQDRDTR